MNQTFMKERRIFPLVLSMALPMMLSVTYSGTLEALGEGVPSLVISLMRYIVVIIPAAFILSRVIGAVGVWWAFVITECTAAVAACILFHGIWGRKSKANAIE